MPFGGRDKKHNQLEQIKIALSDLPFLDNFFVCVYEIRDF